MCRQDPMLRTTVTLLTVMSFTSAWHPLSVHWYGLSHLHDASNLLCAMFLTSEWRASSIKYCPPPLHAHHLWNCFVLQLLTAWHCQLLTAWHHLHMSPLLTAKSSFLHVPQPVHPRMLLVNIACHQMFCPSTVNYFPLSVCVNLCFFICWLSDLCFFICWLSDCCVLTSALHSSYLIIMLFSCLLTVMSPCL